MEGRINFPMPISKYAVKIIISAMLVFDLSAGSHAFASQLGSKEELDLDLGPIGSEPETSERKEPVKASLAPEPIKEAPVPVPAPPKVPVVSPKVPVVSPKPMTMMPPPEPKAPPKVTPPPEPKAPPRPAPPPEPVIPQAIKAQPIKVVEKPAEDLKAPEAPKPAVSRIEAPKPAVRVAQAVKSYEKDKGSGIINRWFGLETGVKEMGPSRGVRAEIRPLPASGDIFTLDDCIRIAIKNSIPLQISEKSVKLAEMRIIEARRNMLPSVTIAFEPYSGKVNERNYIGRKQYIEGKQPLYHGGELYFTLKQAETNLAITKAEGDKIRNELVLQVKKAYYTLAKTEDNLRMQTELSGEVERIFHMVNDQYDANVASRLELLNVSSQLSQTRFQLASAEGDVSVAELILKQAMNVDPEINIDVKPKLEFNRIKVNYKDALVAAFMNRPEMRTNLLMIEYYAYGKKIAASHSLPKVDLMGSWGLAKEYFTPLDNAWADTGFPGQTPIYPEQKLEEQWYAGIKTSIPFWGSTAEYSYTREQWTPVISAFQGTEATTNSFKLKLLDNLAMYSDRQLSEIDFDRARQELNKIKQDVTLEVKEQCFNYHKALIQLETASNKVRYQESDFEFTKMKRSLDEVPDSGVIESMIKLFQERFGYVQALTDCHTAIAGINKAIGIEDYFKDE